MGQVGSQTCAVHHKKIEGSWRKMGREFCEAEHTGIHHDVQIYHSEIQRLCQLLGGNQSLTTKLKYESDLWMYLWSGCKRRGPLQKPVGQASASSPYNSVFQPTSSKRTYLGNLRQPAYPSSQLSSSASPTSSAPAPPWGPQLHPTHVASLHGILFYACAALTGGGDGKLTAAGGGGGGSRLFLLPYPSQGLVHLMLHFGKRLLLHGLLARRQRAGQRLPRCLERLQPQLLASSAPSPPTTTRI